MYVLVVGNVLVHAGVDDVSYQNGLNVLEQDKGPHQDNGNGKTIANIEYRFVSQRVTNRNGSDDETGVGEDHGPPSEMEVNSPGVDDLKTMLVIDRSVVL